MSDISCNDFVKVSERALAEQERADNAERRLAALEDENAELREGIALKPNASAGYRQKTGQEEITDFEAAQKWMGMYFEFKDKASKFKARAGRAEAECEKLKQADVERVRYITKVVEQRDAAQQACAEKDAALYQIVSRAAYSPTDEANLKAIEKAARAALSPTCGQRYARIVEAAERLMPADFAEHPQDFTEEWHKLHRALAATETSDD